MDIIGKESVYVTYIEEFCDNVCLTLSEILKRNVSYQIIESTIFFKIYEKGFIIFKYAVLKDYVSQYCNHEKFKEHFIIELIKYFTFNYLKEK